MSHIHNICGNLNAAADYQEYLARLGAARRARVEAGLADGLRSFDSAIDPDRDAEGDRDGETEGEGGSEPEDKSGGEPGDAGESGPTWHGQA
jgi:hypothetical protein